MSSEPRWKTLTIVDRVIATLVAFRRPERVSVPNNPISPHSGGNFASIVEECINVHNDVISGNNGIKRSNVAELLIPLGVLPSDFLEALLIQLDQTGKKRGDMVHKSSRVSVRTIRDPFAEELKDIEDLVDEIKAFDAKLETLGLLSTPIVVPVLPVA